MAQITHGDLTPTQRPPPAARATTWIERAHLDLMLGWNHPGVSDYRFAPCEEHILRARPLIRLMIGDPARGPPTSWSLRFCRCPPDRS